ncbi:hypothetical protein D6774_03150 [Candidatus Woesearchaeota archaeon]|jgi:hypothetical protein|nr:MAG: hypothetical protein D6774_03150 [Candidatus Woesearchaeota archaeon]
MSLTTIAQFLYDIGFYDVILPFLFIFTIVFAVLQKSTAFGTYEGGVPKKNINALVAFVVGFLFVASISRVAAFESIAQRISLALVAMVMVSLVLGAFGQHLDVGKSKAYWIVVLIIVVAIFVSSLGFSDYISGRSVLEVLLTPWLVMIFFFLLVVWFIVRDTGTNKPKETTKKKVSSSSKKSESPVLPQAPEGFDYKLVDEGVPPKK